MSLFGLTTSNPAFTNYFWKNSKSQRTGKMSLRGIILKSIFCLLLVALSAAYTWKLFFDGIDVQWYTTGGIITALVCSIVISVRREWTMPLTLIYAVAKGLFIGGFSAYIHKSFPYLPFQAVIVTLLTFLVMLLLYMTGIIKVTKKFRSIVITVISVIFLIYITAFILRFFDIHFSVLWDSSWFAIVFNVIVAIFASLSLLLDFDFYGSLHWSRQKTLRMVCHLGIVSNYYLVVCRSVAIAEEISCTKLSLKLKLNLKFEFFNLQSFVLLH